MARTLDVYLHKNFVGQLIQDDRGQMLFDYDRAWVVNPEAVGLSLSLPLREKRFKRSECRGFFAGILPEEGKRKVIARNLGISARNDFSMLEQIGGECAGAVTFMPAGESLPSENYHYKPLSSKALASILQELPRKPLMAGEKDIRLSLAGAQDKITVHRADGKVSLPLGGAPSTHILKPAIESFEGLVFNEAFCMQVAAAMKIPVSSVKLQQAQGIDYLLVNRYDRELQNEGTVQRLHQEDFCQALGISPEMKYQSEGGPGLKACFELLRTVSSTPVIDLQHLLDAVIFNYLIGNNDAHGKNFSLLYHHGTIRMTPLYDLVSTLVYPELSKKMAMKIGGEYEADKILPHHFEKLSEEAGLGKALVINHVPELARKLITALKQVNLSHPMADKISRLTTRRCQSVLKNFSK